MSDEQTYGDASDGCGEGPAGETGDDIIRDPADRGLDQADDALFAAHQAVRMVKPYYTPSKPKLTFEGELPKHKDLIHALQQADACIRWLTFGDASESAGAPPKVSTTLALLKTLLPPKGAEYE